jgi:hypothetical protein
MKIRPYFLYCIAALGFGGPAAAQQINVSVTNLTHANYFTPLLVVVHADGTSLFAVGQPASAELQAIAEGGDTAGLEAAVTALGGTMVANPAGGLLGPGGNASADLSTTGTANVRLSVVAMLLPTNDAFLGLNSILIPTSPGTYVYNVPAYDAGTEANDEIVNGGGAPGAPGIPADPSGVGATGGTGAATADLNSLVHVHRGVLGDTSAAGGFSDLDSRVHRWLNPVARIVVTVQ